MTLIAKIQITGEIHLKTGLHIGGSKGAVEAGALDNAVIKTADGTPYIPGSSLKGSMRSTLEKVFYDSKIKVHSSSKIFEDKNHAICHIFGISASNDTKSTRLLVRDAFLTSDSKKQLQDKTNGFTKLSEEYTETKHENVISRDTGGTITGGLREIERVPAGAVFEFSMMYDVYEEKDYENLSVLATGFRLLQDRYLGGSGSRGYGSFEFKNLKVTYKTLKMYEEGGAFKEISIDFLTEINLAKKIKGEIVK